MIKYKNSIKPAFKATIPIMTGYIVLGIGFGILLESKGYAWYWAGLMSATIYAGSMQFVAVDLLTSGATVIVTALMTFMMNMRHIFYGITFLEKYKNTGDKKPYLIFSLTDETFSLLCTDDLLVDIEDKNTFYFLVSLFNHLYWVIGGVLGGLIGTTIKFNTAGIEFSMTALFVIIFIEQWESTKNHLPALTGLGVSLICLIIFGKSNFLIPAMIGITISLFVQKKINGGEMVDD